MKWWKVIDGNGRSEFKAAFNRHLSCGMFSKLFSYSPDNIKIQITVQNKKEAVIFKPPTLVREMIYCGF